MLYKVRINIHQKIALAGIFSLVIITIVFTIVRITTLNSLSHQPEQSWLYMWSAIENSVDKSPKETHRVVDLPKNPNSNHGRLFSIVLGSVYSTRFAPHVTWIQ